MINRCVSPPQSDEIPEGQWRIKPLGVRLSPYRTSAGSRSAGSMPLAKCQSPGASRRAKMANRFVNHFWGPPPEPPSYPPSRDRISLALPTSSATPQPPPAVMPWSSHTYHEPPFTTPQLRTPKRTHRAGQTAHNISIAGSKQSINPNVSPRSIRTTGSRASELYAPLPTPFFRCAQRH